MHYGVLALIDGDGDVDGLVQDVLAPYQDVEWDWYQIGGRWTGCLSGYDPERDEANLGNCDFCENGITTQEVASKYPAYADSVGKTCIQCKGKGRKVKWPSEWKRHAGDVVNVENIDASLYKKHIHSVVIGGYGWFSSCEFIPWEDNKFVSKQLPPVDWLKKGCKGMRAVVVDCHK